jgi:hypothetical protein
MPTAQVLQLKVVYPLKFKPTKERQVVIRHELAPFGVRYFWCLTLCLIKFIFENEL